MTGSHVDAAKHAQIRAERLRQRQATFNDVPLDDGDRSNGVQVTPIVHFGCIASCSPRLKLTFVRFLSAGD